MYKPMKNTPRPAKNRGSHTLDCDKALVLSKIRAADWLNPFQEQNTNAASITDAGICVALFELIRSGYIRLRLT